MSESRRTGPTLFGWASLPEMRRIAHILRKETIGGALLLVAAAIAIVWANSPWAGGYEAMRSYQIGPAALHLDLSIAKWAADGLLAIFFFVASLELKRELVVGDLRDPRRAAVPVAAAVGGVVVPAGLYLLVNQFAGGHAPQGWAVPTVTDLAFALAALAVFGTHLPAALRTFLLTSAIVDDLIAIVIIAAVYTTNLAVALLLLALLPLAAFTVLVQRHVRSWWLLLPLALVTWGLVHASGVHATVAGVLLAFAVPVHGGRRAGGSDEGQSLAEHFEHRFRPLSAGFAVPVFALTAAGVAFGGFSGLASALREPIVIGILVGLIVGKPLGIMLAAWLVARFTHAHLDKALSWIDVFGLAVLSGIGFTVSLLFSELAFGASEQQAGDAKIAVLSASIVAALLAGLILRLRNRAYRRIDESEAADSEDDEA